MKTFKVPSFYKSSLIAELKATRKLNDKLKKDFSPTLLKLGSIDFYLARHFGFCYGVENAIEIAFKAVNENPGKRIFLLSEMIHNPQVNADLQAHGVLFLMDTKGNMLYPWNELNNEDVLVIPAFGTTLEIEEQIKDLGLKTVVYNTTCPFVEKVWNKSEQIGKQGYTVVVHGKPNHEETRATFSHSSKDAPCLVIKDMEEAILLASFIKEDKLANEFYDAFKNQYSEGFDPTIHLQKIGVVNQTTMLASDTQDIANFLKSVMIEKYNLPTENIKFHFADTRDTLCYATLDNQQAVKGMLEVNADFALVIGGYNSSNTSHLVELCEEKLPTYYIQDASCILSNTEIEHHHFRNHTNTITQSYLSSKDKVTILITSGASCPDSIVEKVIHRLVEVRNQ
jgi:4-hydroxy-3-methylbut-2-enyl diphosphate reductase